MIEPNTEAFCKPMLDIQADAYGKAYLNHKWRLPEDRYPPKEDYVSPTYEPDILGAVITGILIAAALASIYGLAMWAGS